MKKIMMLFFVFNCCCIGIVTAQKYKKIFYKEQSIESADVKVTISDAVATPTGIKFKVIIVNKTSDYIIYKPSESAFKIKGKESNPIEKWLIIRPNESDYKVVDLKGSQHMVAADYQFILDGIYRVSLDTKGLEIPDFKLAPTQDTLKSGNFRITLDKFKKETDRTDAKFDMVYTGDAIGIVDANKIGMKMPDGKEFANYYSEKEPLIFAKNDKNVLFVEWKNIPIASGNMQKAEIIILWRDAFKEVKPEKLPVLILTILFDGELNNPKGK